MKLLVISIILFSFSFSHGQSNQIECLDSPNPLRLFKRHIRDTVSKSLNQETEYLADTIYMRVNPEPNVKYDYLIKGILIELINTKSYDISFLDGVLNLVCQAKNESGDWVDIELWMQPWTCDGISVITLRSKSSLKAISPCYQGTYETTLRYRFQTTSSTFYSNEFTGRINPGQLSK